MSLQYCLEPRRRPAAGPVISPLPVHPPPPMRYSVCSMLKLHREQRAQAAMHDLSYFREHLDLFADMAKRRNITLELEGFRALDKDRREQITANEQRKAKRNKASDEIARLKKEKQNADALIAEMKQVSEQIKQSDERIAELDANATRTPADYSQHSTFIGASGSERCGQSRSSPLGNAPRFLIFSRNRTGKLASAREFWICRPPLKLPARDLPFTRAGARDWNGRWPTSFSMCTPANTVTRKYCRRFW